MEDQGKYALGVWGYTTEFADLSDIDGSGNPLRRDGSYGVYGLAEQVVYHEPEDRSQGLKIFVRVGFADPQVNQFSQYYGGSLVYRGLISWRLEDESGFGLAAAVNGSHFERGQRQVGARVEDTEVALEFTHAMNLTQEILIQPNIQYVINPGTTPTVHNA